MKENIVQLIIEICDLNDIYFDVEIFSWKYLDDIYFIIFRHYFKGIKIRREMNFSRISS
jgi:hypothetical protein